VRVATTFDGAAISANAPSSSAILPMPLRWSGKRGIATPFDLLLAKRLAKKLLVRTLYSLLKLSFGPQVGAPITAQLLDGTSAVNKSESSLQEQTYVENLWVIIRY